MARLHLLALVSFLPWCQRTVSNTTKNWTFVHGIILDAADDPNNINNVYAPSTITTRLKP
jgi:hypothetical protein